MLKKRATIHYIPRQNKYYEKFKHGKDELNVFIVLMEEIIKCVYGRMEVYINFCKTRSFC